MVTREDLICMMALAMTAEMMESKDKPVDMNKVAAAGLDTVMKAVADPLINILEDASPFGKIAAGQIRSIAGKS